LIGKSLTAPGQFVQISVPGIGEAPISICSSSDKHLQLNIREVGNVTSALSKIKKGDKVFLRGPYGKGYPVKEIKGNNLVLVGGGCGVAPLKGVLDYIEAHRSDYKEIFLFVGYRSPDDIIFKREIETWQKKYNLHVTVDKNQHGDFCYTAKEGFITQALDDAKISNENIVAMLCGPPLMMNKVIEILQKKGFHDDQIFISAERLMYCAIGICCHCMIRDKYTCLDGPVFRYDEIKGIKND